jgi:chemotaxis protein MotB
MAGKGGGQWKVAYADFVTAMMAFFLVMWLVSQDQKVREAVANYFIDPSGLSRKPGDMGAMFNTNNLGSVPRKDSVDVATGRRTHSPPSEPSPPTKLLSDYLAGDEKANKYWRKQARAILAMAPSLPDVQDKLSTPEEAAAQELARQLREEFTKGVPQQNKGFYHELMSNALADVNWLEIAEDLLAK